MKQLQDMYKAGTLGIDPAENFRLWDATLWFSMTITHALEGAAPAEHWSDVVAFRDTVDWDKLLNSPGETYDGITMIPETVRAETEEPAPDENNEFNDVSDLTEPADGANWQSRADALIQAKQTVGLCADTLGPSFQILWHAVVHDWTPKMLAETDGYGHRVTGAAYGMGMVRSALRQLAYFRDRLASAERGETPRKFFPLAGRSSVTTPPPARSGTMRIEAALSFISFFGTDMTTLSDLVRATIERTKQPRPHVEQSARALQKAGMLSAKNIVPLEGARLLIALAARKASEATAFTNEYASLERIRWHNAIAAPGEPNEPQRAGDAIERLVASIWGGSREHIKKTVMIIQSWPEIVIDGDHYHPSGTLMETGGIISEVRRSLEIPACIIAQIGADLGHTGCRYAV